MKVLVNGGVNLSELDGWWAKAYMPDLGWALGDGQEHGSDPAWDAAEAETLYERLEREVIPEFYTRNEKDIPVAWVSRMRESMSRLTPHFAADRTGANTLNNIISRRRSPANRVLPTKESSASKWWIGGIVWNRNGPRFTSAQ